MPSNGRPDLPNFPQPTLEDAAALERVRELNRMSPHEYLRFLMEFTKSHPPSRDDLNSPDDEPFVL